MSELLPCQNVDLALSLQQTIREREAPEPPSAVRYDICGKPSVGYLDGDDDTRLHFCAGHVRQPQIVRD